MRVLNKLDPGVNYIAIEVDHNRVKRLNYKEAEILFRDLKEALYDEPVTIYQDDKGDYRYE